MKTSINFLLRISVNWLSMNLALGPDASELTEYRVSLNRIVSSFSEESFFKIIYLPVVG